MNKHEILKRYFGYDAFRTGQEALVDALLCGRVESCRQAPESRFAIRFPP